MGQLAFTAHSLKQAALPIFLLQSPSEILIQMLLRPDAAIVADIHPVRRVSFRHPSPDVVTCTLCLAVSLFHLFDISSD